MKLRDFGKKRLVAPLSHDDLSDVPACLPQSMQQDAQEFSLI